MDILSESITELRKGEFDKVTIKKLQLNKRQVYDELITVFIKSANKITNKLNFLNKNASDAVSKYNQLKLEFDNNKFHQDLTNIQLDGRLTTGLSEFIEFYEKTTSTVDEALLQNRKTIVLYIMAILL